MAPFFYFLDESYGDLERSPAGSVQNTPKVQNLKRVAIGKCALVYRVFEIKKSATDHGNLCSRIVLEKCSKMWAFSALWWLSRTEVAGKCLKVPKKCRM